MTIARFFFPESFSLDALIELPDDVTHHIRVRRVRAGDDIVLFDGCGHEARARLVCSNKTANQAQILEVSNISRELRGRITLVQALTNQDKLDWVIEKATELGVHQLILVQASRSVVKLDGDRAKRRTEHGRRLIISASEQCGRNELMQLKEPVSLKQALDACGHLPKLAGVVVDSTESLLSPRILQRIAVTRACAIFIGPEGGWSPEEQKLLLASGSYAVQFGRRVLRTETAGLFATSALTALLDWG